MIVLCSYMYSESLGRWRTADLLIGLAYLARREGQEHPVADIASKGKPIGLDKKTQPSDVLVGLLHSILACQSACAQHDFTLPCKKLSTCQHKRLYLSSARGICSSILGRGVSMSVIMFSPTDVYSLL